MTKDSEWDVLFTDVIITRASAMAELVILRNALKPLGRVITLDPRRLPGLSFAGSTAYLVNHRSISKLAALLKPASFELPYDLFLKALILEGKIKAHVTFPFLTTVSEDSGVSSIQGDTKKRAALIFDTFRRMAWIRGDEFDPSRDLQIFKKDLDNRALDYGLLWASMTDSFWSSYLAQ